MPDAHIFNRLGHFPVQHQSRTLPISAFLVNALQHLPKLQTVHFEVERGFVGRGIRPIKPSDWEEMGIHGTLIRRFTHRLETLFDFTTYSQSATVAPKYRPEVGRYCCEGCREIHLSDTSGTGDSRPKYLRTEESKWDHASDYDGSVIPREVVEEMVELDGIDRWRGGQIELSVAAWQKVVDWTNTRRKRKSTAGDSTNRVRRRLTH